MLSTFILTERNAFYYQGDELGMVNPRFNSIDEYQDLETRNKYISLKNKGGLKLFLEIKNKTQEIIAEPHFNGTTLKLWI
jgi:oligo-1,6-glucosidase